MRAERVKWFGAGGLLAELVNLGAASPIAAAVAVGLLCVTVVVLVAMILRHGRRTGRYPCTRTWWFEAFRQPPI